MTYDEKLNFVREWCPEVPCDDCPLNGVNCEPYKGVVTEAALDHMITLIQEFEKDATDTAESGQKVTDLFTGETKEIPTKLEAVNHPDHYQGPHECIEIMEAMFGREAVKDFCRCNAFKYRFRADKKNGKEDIKKAEFYEDYLIKMGGIDNEMS